MRIHGRLVATAALASSAMLLPRVGHAQITAADQRFSPILAPAPRGISSVLEPDSSVATSRSPDLPSVGAESNACRTKLRDPRTGARYVLVESKIVENRMVSRLGHTVQTTDSQGNYTADGKTEINLSHASSQCLLRVACANNFVLGLAGSLK